MKVFEFIAYLVAALCFLLAVLSGTAGRHIKGVSQGHLLAAGLLAWVLVPLVVVIRSF